jgi:phosphohistidine swiveling domain-containing protein
MMSISVGEGSARERAALVDLLDEDRPASVVGGKAAPLARAARVGHAVPQGLVVLPASPGGAMLAADLEVRLARLGDGPFAVRSSAVGEDGATRSFAGQLETELGVARSDVAAAVERCRASASALRALRYGGGTVGEVAVIVQRMVAARAAGVAFSADPRSGERGVVVIEATRGLGDRLVSGAVDPEGWRLEGATCKRTREVGEVVLSEAEARAVAKLARAMEDLFGSPQDVEWAFDGDEVVLLQSRPITALPAAPVPIPIEIPKGSWERDDHHAVLSPLGWAWFQPYPKAMGSSFADVGLPLQGVEAARIGGHLYLRFVTGGPEGGAPPPRWVLWLVSRLLPSMRRAERAARRQLDEEAYVQTIDLWETTWRPAMRADITSLFHAEPACLSDDELLERIDKVMALTARGLQQHAVLGGAGMMGLGKLVLFAMERLGWSGNEVWEVATGASTATTELQGQIEVLVRRHRGELAAAGTFPRTWALLAARCPGLAADLAKWLNANRLRILHYDPKHPTLGERPEYVLSIAEGAARALDDEPSQVDQIAEKRLEDARTRLDDAGWAELQRLVAQARRIYGFRDENGVETVSRPAGLLRHFVLELGRRLGAHLDLPEHAVYLTPEEHRPALRGEIPDLRERVTRRRGEESWALRNRGPVSYGPEEGEMPDPGAFPSGLRRVFTVMGWMMKGEEPLPEDPSGPLRGLGLGDRVVTGKARVVERPEELARVRHGEIVVCRITSPEWSVGLGRVAALVTEEGGALSHPAIIARELGVPAVLGATGAMRRISTGDRVRVDPITGVIEVLARE